MSQTFQVPSEWKSEKWWNNRPLPERTFHCKIPRRWKDLTVELPDKVSSWVSNYKPGASLFLTGRSGSGKTSVAVTLLKHFLKEGLAGRFITSERYIEMLKDCFENDGLLPEMYSTPYLVRYIQGVFPIVVLDGVGNERETDFSTHEIGSLIRRRDEDLHSLIITTHLDHASFVRRYGERVAGSIDNMEVVRV